MGSYERNKENAGQVNRDEHWPPRLRLRSPVAQGALERENAENLRLEGEEGVGWVSSSAGEVATRKGKEE